MSELLRLVFAEQFVFFRSQLVFLFLHFFLPAFALVFRHLDSHNQSQQSSSYEPAQKKTFSSQPSNPFPRKQLFL